MRTEKDFMETFQVFLFLFLRQDVIVYPRPAYNSLCRPGWPQTHKDSPALSPESGIQGMCHHTKPNTENF